MLFSNHLNRMFTLLCGSEFVYYGTHFNDYTRSLHAAYGVLIMQRGRADIRLADGGQFTILPGDVVWIPKNAAFAVAWSGDPVDFPMVHFDFTPTCDPFLNKDTDIQKLEGVRPETLLPDFLALAAYDTRRYEADGSNAIQYNMASLFFRIFALIEPLIHYRKISDRSAIRPALDYIRQNYKSPVTVKELADLCFMSTSRFQHVFTRAMGMPPIKYKNVILVQHVRQTLIADKSLPIETVATNFGFESIVYFCRLYKSITGMTPTQSRKSDLVM